VATQNRDLEIALLQPSWARSRAISDRINERYPRGAGDRDDVAVAKNDAAIKINIPQRFRGREEELLALISHLYIQRAPNFEPEQAERLGAVLLAEPRHSRDVMLAWVSLGKTALPAIRRYYTNPAPPVALTALAAGAQLADEDAVDSLDRLARNDDPAVRREAAHALMYLHRSVRASQSLIALLDDSDKAVRLQAYESLAGMADPMVLDRRRVLGDPTDFKLILDVVPSKHPMVYISQIGLPRIAVFSANTGFHTPMLAKFWDNRLMIQAADPSQKARVYYQPPGRQQPIVREISPALANLIFLLADKPTANLDSQGLDLPYSQVVGALYSLRRQGLIDADLEIQASPLATAVASHRNTPAVRPERDVTDDLAPATQPSRVSDATPGMRPER